MNVIKILAVVQPVTVYRKQIILKYVNINSNSKSLETQSYDKHKYKLTQIHLHPFMSQGSYKTLTTFKLINQKK